MLRDERRIQGSRDGDGARARGAQRGDGALPARDHRRRLDAPIGLYPKERSEERRTAERVKSQARQDSGLEAVARPDSLRADLSTSNGGRRMSLTVVTWKWKPAEGYRSTYGPETVNVLRRMVARHYPEP